MSDLTPNTLNPRTPDSANIEKTLERNAHPMHSVSPAGADLVAATHREPAPGEPPLPDNEPPLPGDPMESPPAPELLP